MAAEEAEATASNKYVPKKMGPFFRCKNTQDTKSILEEPVLPRYTVPSQGANYTDAAWAGDGHVPR